LWCKPATVIMYKFLASWCFVLLRLRRPISQASHDSPNLLKKMNNYVWVPRGCNLETVSSGFVEPGLATRYWPLSSVPSLYRKFRTKCLLYMEGSELSAFLIWKVQSSVPSLYARFRAQCLPYMEGSELGAFLIWKVPSSVPPLYGSSEFSAFHIWKVQSSVPSSI